MPNRIIKESIKRSPEIDKLNWFDEVVFYRMIVTADDYGRLDGRIIVLKNDLFPTKDTITRKAIEDAVSQLVSVGLLISYVDEVSGMPYLAFRSWSKHQRIRDCKAKYPAPPEDAVCGNLRRIAADCGEPPRTTANRGENPLARVESESESNPNPIQSDTRAGVTVQRYAVENLVSFGARAGAELNSFIDDDGMDEAVIRHAIDNALDQGKRTWSYARAILNRYADEGVKTVGEAKAADARFNSRKNGDPAPEMPQDMSKQALYG